MLKSAIQSFVTREKFPKNPFGTSPRADLNTYLQLHEDTCKVTYPEIDHLEQQLGYSIDRHWLEDLALHTQVVVKKSKLNYQHGRILYATLRFYLASKDQKSSQSITILETGTARGFSALCMSKGMIDANVPGKVVTLDCLPHNQPIFWNCIDDHEGKKTRQQLLAPWSSELDRVVFVQGWTKDQLKRTGLSRVHFAFLDAQHTKEDVLFEYAYVRDRQLPGDIVIFDDVTPGLFDGVVDAVRQIEIDGLYTVERLTVSNERGYAIARRN
jgi:predicted O-methyltransferase YrrM